MIEPTFINADCLHLPFADQSVDLVFGSPPYCDARTYGIGATRTCQEWIDWMLAVTKESLRVARNCVVWVAAGVTRKRNYWPACEGLMYEWWKGGGSMYRPCYWHKNGIPASGGKDWFRHDVEHVMCFKRRGALPWSDNTAMGHPPKCAPGGEMSHRLKDGSRRNQFCSNRRPNDKRRRDSYAPPAIANPGTLVSIPVGGGLLGHALAHDSEAAFPEKLADHFIRSLCPPGGIVLDPFSGSGTTVAAAIGAARRGIGVDLRDSQCLLGSRRCDGAQMGLAL